MPPHIRAHLAENDEILKKWAQIIVDLYQNLLVPKWNEKVTPIKYFPNLADKVYEQVFTKNQIEKLTEEYHASDKYSLNDKQWF